MKTKRTPKVETYKDSDGEWRTRVRAKNGRIVLPQESHKDSTKAKRAIRAAIAALTDPSLRWVDL